MNRIGSIVVRGLVLGAALAAVACSSPVGTDDVVSDQDDVTASRVAGDQEASKSRSRGGDTHGEVVHSSKSSLSPDPIPWRQEDNGGPEPDPWTPRFARAPGDGDCSSDGKK